MDFLVDDYIKKYGDITIAINEAIQEASKNKGRVIFSAGKIYVSGTIYLKDDITLYF